MNDTVAPEPRIFLSHASHDAATAERLCAALEGAGQGCWIAPRDVPPGEPSAASIAQAISDCRLMVVLLSAQAAASLPVLHEVEQASSKGRPLLVIRLDPAALSPALDPLLDAHPGLDASRETIDDVLPALIGALRTPALPARHRTSRPWPLLAAFLVLVVAGLLADRFWISRHGPEVDPPTAGVPPTAIPDLPVVPTVAEKSLAVLPFTDLSEQKDQAYFSDGLSEDLIEQLMRVPGLQVPARASSFHFRGQGAALADIAAALSVTYVLEGTVRKAGNAVRVHADMVRAATGVSVWSATFDREAKDIFRVQDEIAGRVAAALQLDLPRAGKPQVERSVSSEAYRQVLLGRHFLDQLTEAGFRDAVDAFHEAIRLDPNAIAGWCGLAYAEIWLADRRGDPAGSGRALAAADTAIRLAPDSAAGYAARGWVRAQSLWDWTGAASDYDRVQALDPDHYPVQRATLSAVLGNAPEAIRLLELAARQDPLSASTWASLSMILIQSGRIDEGRAAAHRALDIDPDSPVGRRDLSMASLLAGHPEEALPDAQAVSDEVIRLTGVALAQHSLGIEGESQRALDALIKGYAAVGAYPVAEVYAWRGDRDLAFAWLDRALAQHDAGLTQLKLDPLIGSLRSDPRYATLLRRLKLPP